jgi:hypothetical protein
MKILKILLLSLFLQNIIQFNAYSYDYWRELVAGILLVGSISVGTLSALSSLDCKYSASEFLKKIKSGEHLKNNNHLNNICDISFKFSIAQVVLLLVVLFYITYLFKRYLRLKAIELHPRAHVNENL